MNKLSTTEKLRLYRYQQVLDNAIHVQAIYRAQAYLETKKPWWKKIFHPG